MIARLAHKDNETRSAPLLLDRLFSATNTPTARRAKAWLDARLAKMERDGRFSEDVTVTPELAELLLARNPNNRHINETSVRRFADAMRRGDWELNGEPIIISDGGELNDGQHRLLACVRSGISFQTFIVFGVGRDSRKTVDLGTKRTAAHVLGMSGEKHVNALAAALKMVMNYEDGAHLNTHRTPQEVEAALDAHPDVRASLRAGYRVHKKYKGSAGGWVALHYLMARRDRAKADKFFEMLETRVGITSKSHPVSRLADRLTENLAAKAKLPWDEVAAIAIKAWNAFRAGKNTETLRWRTAGDSPEAFPKVS